MKLLFKIPFTAAVCAATFVGLSSAHEWYVSGQATWTQPADSKASGEFTSDWSSGQGTTIPYGTNFPAGSQFDFETTHNDGLGGGVEVGARFANGLRGSLEVSYTKAGVDAHSNIQTAAGSLDGEDASILYGQATPSGYTVGYGLRSDDRDLESTSAFANVYYDFNRGGRIEPYVGAGIGASKVKVTYYPEAYLMGTADETKLAYQGKAGVTYSLTNKWEVFGEYTYRATDDVKMDLYLVPASVSIENKQHMVGLGMRYRFGG